MIIKYCDLSVENLELLESKNDQEMENELKLITHATKQGQHFMLPFDGHTMFNIPTQEELKEFYWSAKNRTTKKQ